MTGSASQGIDDLQGLDDLPVLKVFGMEGMAPGCQRGGHDLAVPDGKSVTATNVEGAANDGRIQWLDGTLMQHPANVSLQP